MTVSGLEQVNLNTTLMGCVAGAARHYGIELSVPMLFGLTGHAFLINIHGELCPSGPYVWGKDRFYELLRGIGIGAAGRYEMTKESAAAERAAAEQAIREHLDHGRLCMLDLLEHQLLSGYDETGFTLLEPWDGKAGSTLPRISFGTWQECMERLGWAQITVLERTGTQAPRGEALRSALAFAGELWSSPGAVQEKGYTVGAGAYPAWVAAVGRGVGTSHGHWWNAMVWSECRRNAAELFTELANDPTVTGRPGARELCDALADTYRKVSDAIRRASDRELAPDAQSRELTSAMELEGGAVAKVARLASMLA